MTAPADPFPWTEAILTGEQRRGFDDCLALLIAFNAAHHAKAIGTAFLILAEGSAAVACTVAHNFNGIRRAQNPNLRSHPTTPPEFTALQSLNLDAKAVRACVVNGDRVEMAQLTWAVQDQDRDLAFFGLETQEPAPDFFKTRFGFTSSIPTIGAEVCALGYRNSVASEAPVAPGSDLRDFQLRRTLVLRRGRVVEHHERHVHCKGPCVEISIATHPGMSGGPVIALPNGGDAIKPLVMIGSDLDVPFEQKMDRSQAGATIVTQPPLKVRQMADGEDEIISTVPHPTVIRRK